MRIVRFVAAVSMSAGLALSAGSAFAGGENDDRIDSEYFMSDEKCDDANPATPTANYVENLDLDGDSFDVSGYVEGIGSPPGDFIQISYFSDLLNKVSVSNKNGSVSQKEWSELCIFIDTPGIAGGNDLNTCLNVEKCSVKSSVSDTTNNQEVRTIKGKASASCSGTNLFGVLTGPQVTSLETAFPPKNKCGVNLNIGDPGKKSTLKINLNDPNASDVD